MKALRAVGVVGLLMVSAACANTLSTPRQIQSTPPTDQLSQSIDSVLTTAFPSTAPGATAIVVREGRVVYRKAFGLANVELQVPMRPEHVFGIASLSKQFAAAAILKLAEQGKLSVDDDISRFLPTYPTQGSHITIEHLLTHTSGINALSETSDLRAVSAQESRLADVLGDWVKDLPPDSAPGERWAYSNFGYNLLAAIIEQASGQTYAEFLQRQIFDPVGMTHTFYNDRRRVVPFRATGYDEPADTAFNVLPTRSRIFHPGGAGSLLSTVDDLARWNDALASGRVISEESLARMFRAYRLNGGASTNYGYAWDIGEYAGRRAYEHAGGTTGFVSHMVYMPDDRVFVCLLSNKASAPTPMQTLAHQIAAIAIGQPIQEPRAVPQSTGQLDALAGTYQGDDVGTFTVRREGERLLANVAGFEKLELVPVAPLTFRTHVVTWAFVFELDGTGRAARVRVKDWKLNDLAARIEPSATKPPVVVVLEEQQLDACAGEYESLNGILMTVTRISDHLSIKPTGQPAIEILPVSPTEFFTKDGSVRYAFVADSSGRVTGFLRGSGTRAVPARRIGVAAALRR